MNARNKPLVPDPLVVTKSATLPAISARRLFGKFPMTGPHEDSPNGVTTIYDEG